MFNIPTSRGEASKINYGSTLNPTRYNPEKCAYRVYIPGRRVDFHQCTRNPEFGSNKIFCKQHDPIALEKRKQQNVLNGK